MALCDWHILLMCILLLGHSLYPSDVEGSSGYFRKVENAALSPMDLDNLRVVTGFTDSIPCGTMCLLSTCRSLVYDHSSRTCYLSSVQLNLNSSCCKTTGLTYMELSTLCCDSSNISPSSTCCPTQNPRTYAGCIEAKNQGNSESGPYLVDPDGSGSFSVWCDFIGNEAWAVFQRRLNGSVEFYRGWNDYKNGFGDINGEYWLGLEHIYRLTKRSSPKLHIYLDDFTGASRTAKYSFMTLTNETDFYRMTVGVYSGDAGDCMQRASGMMFSTYDSDHDTNSGSCAVYYKGAWWYESCHNANLNGAYLRGSHTSYADGVEWSLWHGYNYSLRTTIMRIAV